MNEEMNGPDPLAGQKTLRVRVASLEGKTTNNYNTLNNLSRRVAILEKEVGMVQQLVKDEDSGPVHAPITPGGLMGRVSNEEKLTEQDANGVAFLAQRVARLENTVGISNVPLSTVPAVPQE